VELAELKKFHMMLIKKNDPSSNWESATKPTWCLRGLSDLNKAVIVQYLKSF
jgi:hypothetical protein